MRDFKDFKKFLAENCWDLKIYKEGGYDKIIFDYFQKDLSLIEQASGKTDYLTAQME
jgi:hypothetical protein